MYFASILGVLVSTTSASATPSHDPALSHVIGESLTQTQAYERLEYLSDMIGPRLSGSQNLKKSLKWAEQELKNDHLDRVWTEKVMVPHWVRGKESAQLTHPVKRPLRILGLGGSVGTKGKGLVAPVLVVESFDELDARSKEVKGKIVLFNRAMDMTKAPFAAYGEMYPYRANSAARAAKYGAVGVLVRSLASKSLYTPHTGGMRYEDGVKKIPAAAITVEDAGLLARLSKRGLVKVNLRMGAKTYPDAPSVNVIGEIRGSEKPDEIILVGGHIDSWDVGSGSHDDGSGVVVAMEALAVIKRLGLKPKRTIRVVLFTNEENGLQGGYTYAQNHLKENHVVAIEADAGAGKPMGFRVQAGDGALTLTKELAAPLRGLGIETFSEGGAGADLIPLTRAGVAGLGLKPDGTGYFELHHTRADTFDKISFEHLSHQVATVAGMVWILSESSQALPRAKPVAGK